MLKQIGLIAAFAAFFVAPAYAAPEIAKPAPEIVATDVNGDAFKLSDHKGKLVVLEWTNHQCPFVVKHYASDNMQTLQKNARADGVEWITIISSAPGRQGHVSAKEALDIAIEKGAEPTTIILDEDGEIGKIYDAQTTPHMYVVDKDGNLAYAGAIDDNSSPRQSTVEGAKNYVVAALADLSAGNKVATAQTPPYGCSVKYAK